MGRTFEWPQLQRYVLPILNLFVVHLAAWYAKHVHSLPNGTHLLVCHVGDMNMHFDNPLQSLSKKTLTTLSLNNLIQVINKPTHMYGQIIDWVVVRPNADIHRKSTATDSLESDHYCIQSYFNVSVSKKVHFRH